MSRPIHSKSRLVLAVLFLMHVLSAAALAGGDWKVLVDPNNSFNFKILNHEKAVLRAGTGGWGPQWSWFPLGSDQKADGDQLNITTVMPIGNQKPKINLNVKSAASNQIAFSYDLQTDKDVPILMIIASIGVPEGGKAKAVFTHTDDTEQSVDLPMNPSDFGVVKKIVVTGPAWEGPITVTLDPPIQVGGHGEVRIMLARETIKSGSTQNTITWTFPGDSTLLVKKSDIAAYAPVLTTPDWFAYQPKCDTGKSAIGMEDWLDKPAGKHGGVRMKADQFVFEDGTPVKFWGMNLSYGLSAPDKANAEFTAARFAKHGINAVRMHKFTGLGWEGIGDANVSTKMKPDGLDRLDYFANELTQNGVYYGWSHSFNFVVRPGDKSRVAGFDELMKKGGHSYAVINWAEDVQDLMIETVVNLLKHQNPYTGKTYAHDPALSYIELQNEDDIFFFTTESALNDFPIYRKQLETKFAQWLTTKYGSQDKLAAAWKGAIKDEDTLAGSVAVNGKVWEMSDQHLPQTNGGTRQRLLDTAAFLHFTQNKFYTKFVKAIRDAGYLGPLVGSPWQAPSGLPHYYNLQSDDMVGYIDRHNYYGGHFADTMLKTPGGGYLSSGLQQVANKPFGISEWIHAYPSLYSAEGPVLYAAYGMGLQGWSASYEFQSNSSKPDPKTAIVGNLPWGIWNADVPTQIGQSPILARMIMRGDVKTAPVISTRRISPQDLEKGEFNFSDTIKQQGDFKSFTGDVPAESLAAGRAVVEFVDKTTPSTFPDMTKYTQGSVITSVTGQLKWDTADGGLVTINTPGTQGYVGFAAGKTLALADVTVTPTTPYASILITAAEPKATLADGGRVLISAIARNSNKGFRILTLDNTTIVDNGTAPIMLEPVRAEVTFAKRKIKQINILDQDGRASDRTLSFTNGKFTIDSAKDHAIYYEVQFE